MEPTPGGQLTQDYSCALSAILLRPTAIQYCLCYSALWIVSSILESAFGFIIKILPKNHVRSSAFGSTTPCFLTHVNTSGYFFDTEMVQKDYFSINLKVLIHTLAWMNIGVQPGAPAAPRRERSSSARRPASSKPGWWQSVQFGCSGAPWPHIGCHCSHSTSGSREQQSQTGVGIQGTHKPNLFL